MIGTFHCVGLCFAVILKVIDYSLSYFVFPLFFVDFAHFVFQNPSLRLFQPVPKEHAPKSKKRVDDAELLLFLGFNGVCKVYVRLGMDISRNPPYLQV